MGKIIFKRLFGFLVQGLLFIAPIGITAYMIYVVFEFVDHIIPLGIPGLGVLIIIAFLTFLGFIGSTVIAKPIFGIVEKIIQRAPFLELVYSSIKDMVSAFVGKDKKFNQPVLVKINKMSNLEKIGFITQTDLSEFKIKDKVAVFFPFSYTFSGELFIVPKEDITPLDIPASEAMKFTISGGISIR
jgi:uncharacterized membrane protein